MIFHACKADGASLGQFEEADFREKVLRRELQPDQYYWREGMTDWKPISEYRPPGKLTTIIGNLPTGKTLRAAASSRGQNTPLKKLKRLLRRGSHP
jgi:GYF domain 2